MVSSVSGTAQKGSRRRETMGEKRKDWAPQSLLWYRDDASISCGRSYGGTAMFKKIKRHSRKKSPEKTGVIVAKIIKKLGWNFTRAAEELCVSRPYISMVVHGRNEPSNMFMAFLKTKLREVQRRKDPRLLGLMDWLSNLPARDQEDVIRVLTAFMDSSPISPSSIH